MSTTQKPDALNLEEFRAKVTRAAREPLLARIAELEAQLSATNSTQQGMDAAVRELIDRLQDAQQDINLAANTHMSQQLASAAALLDEVESTLRALASTPVAGELATLQAGLQAAAPAVLPEPAAWLATFRPKGMLSSHSIAGANFEELKCSVPSDSVFKPLYTRHAEGATAQTGTYAEARECEHCNHVGINDAANGIASCTACKWNGDSPKEDKCPDCEAEGTMTASCPKCHHEYRLIADATLAATQPVAQGMDSAISESVLEAVKAINRGNGDGRTYRAALGWIVAHLNQAVARSLAVDPSGKVALSLATALAAQAKQKD